MTTFDPITLAVLLAAMALMPTLVVVSTAFLKIVVVMSLLRNALGVQQTPPNLALYGLALILAAYIMAPVGVHMLDRVSANPDNLKSLPAFVTSVRDGAEPLREFMLKNSQPEQRDFFVPPPSACGVPSWAKTSARATLPCCCRPLSSPS